jgi:hypothetical protein
MRPGRFDPCRWDKYVVLQCREPLTKDAGSQHSRTETRKSNKVGKATVCAVYIIKQHLTFTNTPILSAAANLLHQQKKYIISSSCHMSDILSNFDQIWRTVKFIHIPCSCLPIQFSFSNYYTKPVFTLLHASAIYRNNRQGCTLL